jgi:BetI-type transcriptional repressor, C-terminal
VGLVLEDIVRRGIAQGELRADIQPAEVAITITALLEGVALLWVVDPQATNWREQAEISVRLLLQGLASSPDVLS